MKQGARDASQHQAAVVGLADDQRSDQQQITGCLTLSELHPHYQCHYHIIPTHMLKLTAVKTMV